MSSRIPVTILTGFLGAGKTTFLNRLMSEPGFGDTAILVNEFGEAGVDGALIERADERAFAMSTGCLCCTISGDVRLTLLRLLDEAERGVGPSFRRIVIETTGLADPAPVVQTFMTNDYLLNRFTLNGIVTLVDALSGQDALDRFEEARRQVAIADVIAVTKTDVSSEVDDLLARVGSMNPNARIERAVDLSADDVFSLAAFDPAGRPPDVSAWLKHAAADGDHHHHHHDVNAHGDAATAFCFSASGPVDPVALEEAIWSLRKTLGRDLLRMKGLVEVDDNPDAPCIVHVVGLRANPRRLLDGWPEGVSRTRLVVIVSGPDRGKASDILTSEMPELQPFQG